VILLAAEEAKLLACISLKQILVELKV